MSKRNIHTTYDPEKKVWKTVLEGQEKPLATSKTKAAAEKKSIREAKKREVEHIIHKKGGLITDSDSYGNEPHPPKDKKH